ncbi:MAG: hypothetical protein J1F68_04505 [Clostridiales bacterium]|nr:hypothetical protein [Clostridiales bacterium]
MTKTKKLVALLVVVALMFTFVATIAACNNHKCNHVCETCGLCQDESCDNAACEDKCQGHQGGTTHTCGHVCPTCQKCTDTTCTNAACASKCPGNHQQQGGTHTCGHVCTTCGKCTDTTCTDSVCANNRCPGHQGDVTCDHTDIVLNVCQDCQKVFTVDEILAALDALDTSGVNALPGTYKLSGVVTAKTARGNYTDIWFDVDGATTPKNLEAYGIVDGDALVADIVVGARVTVTGTLKTHYKTQEFDANCKVDAITILDYAIEVNVSNGTVKTADDGDMPQTAKAGASISFKVTPDNNYKLEYVKVNGSNAQANAGVYTLVVTGKMTIDVSIKPADAPDPTVLAKFEFGANDSTKTNEGSQDGTALKDGEGTYTETNGNYTLTITNPSKVYTGSYDALGNGCLKLGTSSAPGSFTFAVPAEITKVVIYVAGYKANTVSVKYNDGSAITVEGRSAQGTYDAIEIDTTNVRSITFAVASNNRCKINAIEFWGIAPAA